MSCKDVDVENECLLTNWVSQNLDVENEVKSTCLNSISQNEMSEFDHQHL